MYEQQATFANKVEFEKRHFKLAALKHGIRNPKTEPESRKQNTESVKEGSKRSICKKIC